LLPLLGPLFVAAFAAINMPATALQIARPEAACLSSFRP
jgi:hypothetical protein